MHPPSSLSHPPCGPSRSEAWGLSFRVLRILEAGIPADFTSVSSQPILHSPTKKGLQKPKGNPMKADWLQPPPGRSCNTPRRRRSSARRRLLSVPERAGLLTGTATLQVRILESELLEQQAEKGSEGFVSLFLPDAAPVSPESQARRQPHRGISRIRGASAELGGAHGRSTKRSQARSALWNLLPGRPSSAAVGAQRPSPDPQARAAPEASSRGFPLPGLASELPACGQGQVRLIHSSA